MLKISEHLHVDKKHVVRQIIDDLLKSINKCLSIEDLIGTEGDYLYVEEDHTGKDRLISVCEINDVYEGVVTRGEKIISEKESDIEKYYTAYNLMKLYL